MDTETPFAAFWVGRPELMDRNKGEASNILAIAALQCRTKKPDRNQVVPVEETGLLHTTIPPITNAPPIAV